MKAEDMKKSILQLAIQGKLVKQDPNDEPASILLAKIKREKEQLIKEKKIKKEKPLPKISEEEKLFEIPQSWEWVRLGDVFNIVMGQSPKGDSIFTNIQGIEFHQGKSFFSDKFLSKSDKFTILPKTIAEPYSVILSVRAPVGSVNICNRTICIGRGLCAIKGINGVSCEFMYLFLKALKSEFIKKASGTTFSAITSDVVKKQIIPLPPLDEQNRIVSKIEELLPLIEKYDKVETELSKLEESFPEDMKKSILQYAMQGKLVKQNPNDEPASVLLAKIKREKEQLIKEKKIKKEKPLPKISEEEKPFKIPDSWEWVRLGDLGQYRKGPFGSALTKSIFVSKGTDTIKVYEQKNAIYKNASLGDYYITYDYFINNMTNFEIKPKDIIVSCAGTIGETYVMPKRFERGIINQALMRMRMFSPIYIEYFLIYFNFILKETAKKTSKGSAIKNIPPLNKLKNYLVALPPLEEQKRIVNRIEELFKYIDDYKTIINK